MTKLNKSKAYKAFNNGSTIFIVPNKINPNNKWDIGFEVSKDILMIDGKIEECGGIWVNGYFRNQELDNYLSHYMYYNCNFECGYYLSYYIKD